MVHFKELALGSGSNMALPIWGIWMKKCLADPYLDFSESDVFEAPVGMNLDLSCTGGDIETVENAQEFFGYSQDEEEDFFN